MGAEVKAAQCSGSNRSSKWKFYDWEDQVPVFGYWAGEGNEDPGWEDNPEKKLCFAVLLSGLQDLRREGLIAELARDWVRDRGKLPFEFDWVCETLDLDPTTLLNILVKAGYIWIGDLS